MLTGTEHYWLDTIEQMLPIFSAAMPDFEMTVECI
jgi:hypothetical protein